jgi:Holliday junction resolvase RusA-like endonuclease
LGGSLTEPNPREVIGGNNPPIEPVTFTVPGKPQGKKTSQTRGAPKGGGKLKGRGHYTPSKTRAYEAAVGAMASIAMRGRAPIDDCVALCLRAVFEIPASWSTAKRNRAIVGEILPGVKPDLSNIIKAIEDGMKGIVLTDDARIVDLSHCKKVYGLTPMVAVTIRGPRA